MILREKITTDHPLSQKELLDVLSKKNPYPSLNEWKKVLKSTEIKTTKLENRSYEISFSTQESMPFPNLEGKVEFVNHEQPFEILLEDENYLAFDKPSGVASHPLFSTEKNTMVGSYLFLYPENLEVGFSPLQAGLIHRLDVETKGVLLFAKNQKSFLEARKNWKIDFKKTYLALTKKMPKSFEGQWIDFPLSNSTKSKKRMLRYDPKNRNCDQSLEARTKIITINDYDESKSLVELEIETGVRHQIRAHLAYHGYPIFGDSIYDPDYQDGSLSLIAKSIEYRGRFSVQSIFSFKQ